MEIVDSNLSVDDISRLLSVIEGQNMWRLPTLQKSYDKLITLLERRTNLNHKESEALSNELLSFNDIDKSINKLISKLKKAKWENPNRTMKRTKEMATKKKAPAKKAVAKKAPAKKAAIKKAPAKKAVAKKAPAKKAVAKKAPAKKAPAKNKKAQISVPIADIRGKAIFSLVEENPRRPGSFGHKSMTIIMKKPGIIYEDFLKKGGRLEDLKWDLGRNVIELRDPK